jgi:hypothetical protein
VRPHVQDDLQEGYPWDKSCVIDPVLLPKWGSNRLCELKEAHSTHRQIKLDRSHPHFWLEVAPDFHIGRLHTFTLLGTIVKGLGFA